MLIRKPSDIAPSDITPASVYKKRRTLIKAAAAAGAIAAFPASELLVGMPEVHAAMKLGPLGKSAFSTDEEQTPYNDVTSYNNFYEFGTGKEDPARNAGSLKTRPWKVLVDGEVKKERTFDIEELLKLAPLEERIYRLRCV